MRMILMMVRNLNQICINLFKFGTKPQFLDNDQVDDISDNDINFDITKLDDGDDFEITSEDDSECKLLSKINHPKICLLY